MDKSEMFKTITFRLNLNHEEDALIYRALCSVEEEKKEGDFDNKTELIKFALGSVFGDNYKFEQAESRIKEQQREFQDWMLERITEAIQKQSKEIQSAMEKEVELAVSKALTGVLAGIVSNGVAMPIRSDGGITKSKEVVQIDHSIGLLPTASNEMPDSAMDFLDNL